MPKNIASTRPVNRPAASAKLVSEGDKIIRSMTLKDGKLIKENLNIYERMMVYFDAIEATFRVTNMISYDQNNELLLTYSFVNGVPSLLDMGADHTAEEINQIIGGVVDKTVDVIRELVKNGSL
ncbi:hypothetical protein CPB83DRAFT_882713 [Crepidotus variabilis]|uniref:Uncharacterized protein n=1 Tax=Crepidotus variabilis TaxID=179855 RepID=A0A9P6EIP6_9AGAR|nr:hypothetical protein CPB83DRAFT_882713 [Crepidotus variabilis]